MELSKSFFPSLTALAKNEAGQTIDKQIYHHHTIDGRQVSNRTYAITDSATITSGEDLLDQIAYDNDADSVNIKNNYTYTEIGERKSNKQDSVSLITWTVYGKLKSVTHQTGCKKSDVEFNYDANNKRISKIVKPRDGSGLRPSNEWITTQYVRDAQGNIMSVYTNNPNLGSFAQIERPIYGSSEIGAETTSLEMIGATVSTDTAARYLGYKHYTGLNHLSNTLVTFTDKKIPRGSGTTLYNYEPEIIGANDYAPFGAIMPGRNFNVDASRYRFGGQEAVDEIDPNHYTAEFWEYDADIGKRWNLEPITSPWESPYATFSNNPILFNDPNGASSSKTNSDETNTNGYEGSEGGTSAFNNETQENFTGSKILDNVTKGASVGEFGANIVKDIKGGDKVDIAEIKDLLVLDPKKPGEAAIGNLLDKITSFGASKPDDNSLDLGVNLKNGTGEAKASIVLKDPNIKNDEGKTINITVTGESKLVIKKISDSSIQLRAKGITLSMGSGYFKLPIPVSAASITISNNQLKKVTILGFIDVNLGRNMNLPEKFQKK